jgi:hypothetical protein
LIPPDYHPKVHPVRNDSLLLKQDRRFFDVSDVTETARNSYPEDGMEKKQRVIVYGNSVVLAGIEAGLSLDPNTEVVSHARTDQLEDLVELHPDVVIFDVDDEQSEFLQSQLQSQPDLLLIGIDPESHEVLLTGQAARSITLDQITRIMQNRDLVQVIHQNTFNIPISAKEKRK